MLDLIWFFTEEGKKNEEQYMQKIDQHIWYNDDDWSWDNQKSRNWENWMITYFEEIMDKDDQL